MLGKKGYNGEFQHLIASVQQALVRRKEVLVFKKRGTYSAVLDLLVRLGLIKTYQELPTLLVIRLRTFGPSGTELRHLSTPNLTLSLHSLRTYQRRVGGSSCYILTTDRGFVTSFDALTQGISGKVLCRVA
jgi:ribosomal protein S8